VTTQLEDNPHIKVWRSFYWHHGVDMGDGTVIHLTGEPGRRLDAAVRQTPIERFLRGGELRSVRHSQPLQANEVRARAARCLGHTGYSILFRNCEHFARWCAIGRHESHQVRDALAGTFAVGFAVVGAVAQRQGLGLLGRAIPLVGPLSLGLLLANAVSGFLAGDASPFEEGSDTPFQA
jgi:hypothetical protein